MGQLKRCFGGALVAAWIAAGVSGVAHAKNARASQPTVKTAKAASLKPKKKLKPVKAVASASLKSKAAGKPLKKAATNKKHASTRVTRRKPVKPDPSANVIAQAIATSEAPPGKFHPFIRTAPRMETLPASHLLKTAKKGTPPPPRRPKLEANPWMRDFFENAGVSAKGDPDLQTLSGDQAEPPTPGTSDPTLNLDATDTTQHEAPDADPTTASRAPAAVAEPIYDEESFIIRGQ